MFRVKYKHFPEKIYTVYSVSRDGGDTWFLIYRYGRWTWAESHEFDPVEE